MAGYMTKLTNYVFEGEYVNGDTVAIENGSIVTINGGVMKLATASGAAFLCKEATTIYDGVPAYRFQVVKPVENLFLVQNETDVNTSCAYDTRTYAVKVGDFVKAHPLQMGDEFVVTTTKNVAKNTAYGVAAGIIG